MTDRSELHSKLDEIHANLVEYIRGQVPDPNVRHHMNTLLAEHFGTIGMVLRSRIIGMSEEYRAKFKDAREGNNDMGGAGVDILPCGDVYADESGKYVCDRPAMHAGPHSMGRGMDCYQWSAATVTGPDPVDGATFPSHIQPTQPWARPDIGAIPDEHRCTATLDGLRCRFVRGHLSDHEYVEGTLSNNQTPIGDTGASSSHAIDVRYEMIPREFLACLGTRFHAGRKHGRFNYRKGLFDKQFVLDRIAHMYEHMGRLFQPMPGDEENFLDNVGAVGWGLAFLCEVYAYPEGREIIDAMMRPTPGAR